MIQSGGFLGRLLGPLLNPGLLLIKNVIQRLTKSVLIVLGWTVAASAADAGIHKNQNEPRFNGVYCINNLPNKIKDGAYVINLDEYSNIGTHWIALYTFNNNVSYFNSFGVERIAKEIKKFIGNKNIQSNIFKMQAYNSVTCG